MSTRDCSRCGLTCHGCDDSSHEGHLCPSCKDVTALIFSEARERARVSLLAHAVSCPNCRIRVRKVEGNEIPGLRGERDPSTLYVEKPDYWILCAEGRTLLEATRA